MFLILYNLSYFQECSYDFKKYFKYYFKKGIKFNIIIVLMFILSFFVLPIYKLLIHLILNFIILYKLKNKKVKFVLTKRIIRLIIVSIILYILNYIYLNYLLFYLFNNAFLIFDYIILLPIEKIIYKYYFNKTKKFFNEYKGIKIGITGSFGKTTTKNFLYEILKSKYTVYKTPKSYNTPMGISKIIKDINPLYDIVIIEMGASKSNDITELMDLVNPDIGILTSIGIQHLNTFKTLNNIINEKTKIVDLLKKDKIGICCFENEYIRKYAFNKNVISYGYNYGIYKIKLIDDKLYLFIDNKLFDIYETKIYGKYNYLNIASAIIASKILNIDKEKIKESVYNLKPVKNRMELKIYNEKIKIIDDSYNSNLEGAIQSLDYLNEFNCEKWIITPGFVESDMCKKNNHLILSKKINQVCSNVILINKKNTSDFLIDQNINLYRFEKFIDGFNFFIKNCKNEAVILILNDLPDNY